MFFGSIEEAPIDPIFGLTKNFQDDSRDNKFNLMIGIYKNAALKAQLMTAVQKAAEEVANLESPAAYLPMDGISEFCGVLGRLVFGEDGYKKNKERIYGAQAVGGTGALRITAEFLQSNVTDKIALPTPSWANHQPIFEKVGMQISSYSYYDKQKKQVDFSAMLSSLQGLPAKSAVLFHVCCHNPTGEDLTHEQWQEVAELVKQKELLPFFDFAYQGFSEGIEEDAFAIRHFLKEEIEMVVTYTCSKNFSLYCHRVGALFVFAKDQGAIRKIQGQVKNCIRRCYSNPPSFGAQIVEEVLTKQYLKKEWISELDSMRARITETRASVAKLLQEKIPNKDFSYIARQKGMFSFLGITPNQVDRLREEYAIYVPQSGRLSVVGLNDKNMEYVAEAIAKVSS